MWLEREEKGPFANTREARRENRGEIMTKSVLFGNGRVKMEGIRDVVFVGPGKQRGSTHSAIALWGRSQRCLDEGESAILQGGLMWGGPPKRKVHGVTKRGNHAKVGRAWRDRWNSFPNLLSTKLGEEIVVC